MIAPLGLASLGQPFGDDGTRVTNALPPDLAGAIVAQFQSGPMGGLTAIYADEASETAVLPYLVFTLSRGTTYRTDSTSYWRDHRVRFTVYAPDKDQANAVRDEVWAAFGGRPYLFATGVSVPFFEADHFEGKDHGRTVGNQLIYRAGIEVSARVRRSN